MDALSSGGEYAALRARDFVRTLARQNRSYLEVMSAQYDIDGAVEAGQTELAVWSAQCLVVWGLEVHLMDLGVLLPWSDERADRLIVLLSYLACMNVSLQREALSLLFDTALDPGRARAYVSDSLHVAAGKDRATSIQCWSEHTLILREVAEFAGLPLHPDWYALSAGAEARSSEAWLDEAIGSI